MTRPDRGLMCGKAPCDSANCTWGEKHRRECEARTVLRWSREKRAEYYADVKKRRGEAAAKDLVTEVKRQWHISQRQPSLL